MIFGDNLLRFRHRYNFRSGVNVNTRFEGESLTEQHHAETTDINKIVATFNRTGRMIAGYNPRPALYADVSNVPQDMLEAHAIIQRGVDAFADFPDSVKARFHYNPEELLAFLNDENNRAEAIALGLLDAPAAAVEQPQQGALTEKLDN